MGTVYLIHFDSPVGNIDNPRGNAQHYLGYTTNIRRRVSAHKRGVSRARLMQVVYERGINWVVSRTWDGDKKLERKLKNRKCARKLCPICQSNQK